MPKANINGKPARLYAGAKKVKSAYLNGKKVYAGCPDYLFSKGRFEPEYLTGFVGARTGQVVQITAQTPFAAGGGTQTASASASSNEKVDWSDIEKVTFKGQVLTSPESFPGSITAQAVVKIGDRVIPLNTKTHISGTGREYITMEISARLRVDAGDEGIYRGIATLNIEEILTE